MQITSSYSVEIRKQGLCFRKTFEVYRSAAAYLIPVFDSVWGELEETGSAKRRFNAAEHLVHNTKKNTARFEGQCPHTAPGWKRGKRKLPFRERGAGMPQERPRKGVLYCRPGTMPCRCFTMT